MKNYDQSVKINHNPNCRYTPDQSYRNLIIGGLGSGKTNVLLNLIKHRPSDTEKNLFARERSIRNKVSIAY